MLRLPHTSTTAYPASMPTKARHQRQQGYKCHACHTKGRSMYDSKSCVRVVCVCERVVCEKVVRTTLSHITPSRTTRSHTHNSVTLTQHGHTQLRPTQLFHTQKSVTQLFHIQLSHTGPFHTICLPPSPLSCLPVASYFHICFVVVGRSRHVGLSDPLS